MRYLWALTSLILTLQAYGQGQSTEGLFNKLLAPGPLIEGHKDLETKDCFKCHEAGGGVPDRLCMDCHKEIREDVQTNTSFHGQVKKACSKCHPDHKGRNYNTVFVNEKTFNHNKTGFKLENSHKGLKCQKLQMLW